MTATDLTAVIVLVLAVIGIGHVLTIRARKAWRTPAQEDNSDIPVWTEDGVLTPTLITADYDGVYRVGAALVPETIALTEGVPYSALVGMFPVPIDERFELPYDDFEPNPVFTELYHSVYERFGPDVPEFRDQAARIGKGRVFLTDGTPPANLRVLNMWTTRGREHIVGSFEVEDGQIIRHSYRPSDTVRCFGPPGVVRVPPSLVVPLREAITAAAEAEDEAYNG